MNSLFSILILIFLFNLYQAGLHESEVFLALWDIIRCKSVCPNDTYPAIAMTPARYTQSLAVIRVAKETPDCETGIHFPHGFDLGRMDTWKFCVGGTCCNKQCVCMDGFSGCKCEEYIGDCYLFSCFLFECSEDLEDLKCACLPEIDGNQTTTGEWWYDDTVEFAYRAPSQSPSRIHTHLGDLQEDKVYGHHSAGDNLQPSPKPHNNTSEEPATINNLGVEEISSENPDYYEK